MNKIEKKIELMPNKYRATYKKAVSGKSRQAAVKAFCCECVGWENASEEVGNCTAPDCPLYPYRPYRSRQTPT